MMMVMGTGEGERNTTDDGDGDVDMIGPAQGYGHIGGLCLSSFGGAGSGRPICSSTPRGAAAGEPCGRGSGGGPGRAA